MLSKWSLFCVDLHRSVDTEGEDGTAEGGGREHVAFRVLVRGYP